MLQDAALAFFFVCDSCLGIVNKQWMCLDGNSFLCGQCLQMLSCAGKGTSKDSGFLWLKIIKFELLRGNEIF